MEVERDFWDMQFMDYSHLLWAWSVLVTLCEINCSHSRYGGKFNTPGQECTWIAGSPYHARLLDHSGEISREILSCSLDQLLHHNRRLMGKTGSCPKCFLKLVHEKFDHFLICGDYCILSKEQRENGRWFVHAEFAPDGWLTSLGLKRTGNCMDASNKWCHMNWWEVATGCGFCIQMWAKHQLTMTKLISRANGFEPNNIKLLEYIVLQNLELYRSCVGRLVPLTAHARLPTPTAMVGHPPRIESDGASTGLNIRFSRAGRRTRTNTDSEELPLDVGQGEENTKRLVGNALTKATGAFRKAGCSQAWRRVCKIPKWTLRWCTCLFWTPGSGICLASKREMNEKSMMILEWKTLRSEGEGIDLDVVEDDLIACE